MAFYLTENEKILIIIFAASLFLLSVVLTVCVVSPFCLFNKWFVRLCNKVNPPKKHSQKQQLITPESKHFQLTVVPLYGSSSPTTPNGDTVGSKSLPRSEKEDSQSRKKRLMNKRKSTASFSSTDSECKQFLITSKIKLGFQWESIDESSVKIYIRVEEVNELSIRDYGVEPTCYVLIALASVGGLRNRKKNSVIAKAAVSFRTNTAKKSLSPTFNETFITSELPKSILKEGRLKIRLMDEERYANDYCLGELNLPLKKFLTLGEKCESLDTYNFAAPKEQKGEILYSICYLPTSRRVTFSIVKATLMGQSPGNQSQNYYVRILMFVNGKLTKKKKTPTSEKMIWKSEDTLTFDMANAFPEETAFMVVLSSSKEPQISTNSSPSSPESPELPTSGSKKDRHIGHCIVGSSVWKELKENPRKQINLCSKLV
ncbi:hypothetical protein B4U79_14430 [Dinothrombium tinctorium]|uniref:C2 domain-containing protein n=1 Tax=Dinothrombium tinctorium TaxID=1965070 RepID=A0A443QN78_9ACAR|nr:hypothetical protein B4U79_14430 [Dinothrombium tinctorium]